MTFLSLPENVGGLGGGMDLRPNTRPFFYPTVFLSLIYIITAGKPGVADAVLTAKAPVDGLAGSLFGHNPAVPTYKRHSFTFFDQVALKRVKRSHFVGRRSYDSADPTDFEDESSFIPDKYILAVKLGVPVRELNQTSLDRLKAAFANSDKLQIPVENVGIDKIRFQGNRVEMFFIKPGHNLEIFGINDLILISEIFTPELIEAVKQAVPELNVTSIAGANYVVIAKQIEPVWKKAFFPYVVAAFSVVIILSIGVLVYCCCKKKTLKHYGAENLLSQQICVYPSHKPGVKDGKMIQPDGGPHYVAKGCITPLPAQPLRIKAKGLLERRGSNASLTIDLTPSPELVRWDGTPPKESSALEYLLSAGNRLSRKDLRNCLKNSQALYEEFWEVPLNLPDKVQVAGSGMKNRYKSIIPNEHSRIKLPDCERDPLSSYINANSLRGYEGESGAYIATQGPMTHTIVDFWRMIWSEHVPIIVMITKLREKNKVKCENYLPESSSQFGEIVVTVDKVTEKKGFIVRHLSVRAGSEVRSVLHYWYTDWPDHRPPDSPKTLIEMVKEVELRRYIYTTENQGSKTPVVVHCSAGIGRTGCFVAISVGMRQIREEHSVDVLGIVCSMRLDRGGMIQTGEQYEFIHHALSLYDKELSEFGNPAD